MLTSTVFQWAQAAGLTGVLGALWWVVIWHEKRLRVVEKAMAELQKENASLQEKVEDLKGKEDRMRALEKATDDLEKENESRKKENASLEESVDNLNNYQKSTFKELHEKLGVLPVITTKLDILLNRSPVEQ